MNPGIVDVAIGLILVIWGGALSRRYNAWTTRLRERSPNLRPPTPQWRARNTKIMTVVFRVFGAAILALGILTLLSMITGAKPH
jgi:hypothetical protein